jgi:hypothetical protein
LDFRNFLLAMAGVLDVRWEREGVDVPTQDVGAEEGFGFDRHGGLPGRSPSVHD